MLRDGIGFAGVAVEAVVAGEAVGDVFDGDRATFGIERPVGCAGVELDPAVVAGSNHRLRR